jgi:hypothetical protein
VSQINSEHKESRRKKRVKQRIRYRISGENEVERNWRKKREAWEIKRQNLEKYIVPFAGIVGITVVIGVFVHLLAKWSCPICMWVIMIVSFLMMSAWLLIKGIELWFGRKYHIEKRHRKAQNSHSDAEI